MKKFGIKVTLPAEDTMRASHLLGDEWETFRWFDTEDERDHIYREMQIFPPYYRRGDQPTQVISKVDR